MLVHSRPALDVALRLARELVGGGLLRRLIPLAGERAAWNQRTPDSWERLMPFRVRVLLPTCRGASA